MLIERLQPKDIYPCTTVAPADWTPRCSMTFLFGHLYHEPVCFRHDQAMLEALAESPRTSDASERSMDVQPPLPVPKPTTFDHQNTIPAEQGTDRHDVRIMQRYAAYEAALAADGAWHQIQLLSTASSLPEEEL
nr:hypothetical protein CFP56_08137 [Quercus suber]